MSALLTPDEPRLTAEEWSHMLSRTLKDKSYRSTPLGLEVARYIRWKRSEWGATKETIRDYEACLARLALFFADLELSDLEMPEGVERLRELIDHYWGDRSPRTRAKQMSVLRDFFKWAIDSNRGMHSNPALSLRTPKKRGVKREPFSSDMVTRVLSSQEYLGDRLGCSLV